MKGFEWLLEEPDVHVKITPALFNRFPARPFHYQQGDELVQSVARCAVLSGDKELLRFAFDIGLRKDSKTTRQLSRHAYGACLLIFIDVGVIDQRTCHWFNQSRNFARSSAVQAIYAICNMDKKYKHVSVIIGRAIWASRGHREIWSKCDERPLKK
jgi:hypothetical protein